MEEENQSSCFGSGSVAGAVIGTFLTTILLLAVAALLYRQWRRLKGKHLVLVTDPEIVEDAYAFDNPCFKDVATPAITRSIERPVSAASAASVETPVKDATRWSTSWSSLGLGSAIRTDKRRTLDDSCLGPKATRVSVVSLRSRDFTGLGFNVCGNMREGIFVKDLLNRGPASESGRIHPGDRIASVKISFRNMVYEDALTILSYASPYDVELEVENGGPGSKPTTLLKKSVGPTPSRICHPLYRSQSIPELSETQKNTAKRLFTADLSETLGSSYSTMNSTMKSSKSAAGNQTLEKRQDDNKTHHHKFGIKVLPALDGMVHRIENDNEHNTNLERRNSKKMDVDEHLASTRNVVLTMDAAAQPKVVTEKLQQRAANNREVGPVVKNVSTVPGHGLENVGLNGIDVPDKGSGGQQEDGIPSEIPEEVHNAAVAARRNRKSSSELLSFPKFVVEPVEADDPKSPQKNKRKAPAPPKEKNGADNSSKLDSSSQQLEAEDKFDSITDYTESLSEYLNKVRETTDGAEARRKRLENQACRKNSESDTDSELQNSFTTIELNPADITIHHTPVPEVDDDIYRKAASLGDLSKYESRTPSTLERAQSLDMTDTGSKKRKAPLPPEDINESTEDLTKLGDDMDTFQRRKLKKSNEWGTLEDAIWNKVESDEDKPRTRKKSSNGTLERSKSAVEMKLKGDTSVDSKRPDDPDTEAGTSIELYNLPLSKKLSYEFIRAERMFNPDEDNSLARIINNGDVVKSPTLEEMELDFRQAKPLRDDEDEKDEIRKALRYFDLHTSNIKAPASEPIVNFTHRDGVEGALLSKDKPYYYNNVAVIEEPMKKVIVDTSCPACDRRHNDENENCSKHHSPEKGSRRSGNSGYPNSTDGNNVAHRELAETNVVSRNKSPSTTFQFNHTNVDPVEDAKRSSSSLSSSSAFHINSTKVEPLNVEEKRESLSTFQTNRTKFEQTQEPQNKKVTPIDVPFETYFAKRIVNLSNDADDSTLDTSSNITVNSRNVSINSDDRHNISNVSVSSGENSEDSGVVKGLRDLIRQDSEPRPPLPSTPMPLPVPQTMTYITEIKVSASQENINDLEGDNDEIAGLMEGSSETMKPGTTVTSNGKPAQGKKPPIPPRRSDATRTMRDEADKQVVYVSEYKSSPVKESQSSESQSASENKQSGGAIGKKFEQWVFLGQTKDNPWDDVPSQPQPVTNIVLGPSDEKTIHQ